jgi:TRAP-type mannitol/chloroaromatic compound transport system permease large subunit
MTWFGTLVAVNLQTAFMTPLFGATLCYMKGTAAPGVSLSDVFKAIYPFVALQVVACSYASTIRASACGCHGSLVFWNKP